MCPGILGAKVRGLSVLYLILCHPFISMVKGRNLDLDTQSANSAAASLKKQYEMELAEAVALLKHHPKSRAPCIKYLKSARFTMEAPLELTKSLEQQWTKRSINSRKVVAQAVAAAGPTSDKPMVPSKHNTCSDVCKCALRKDPPLPGFRLFISREPSGSSQRLWPRRSPTSGSTSHP